MDFCSSESLNSRKLTSSPAGVSPEALLLLLVLPPALKTLPLAPSFLGLWYTMVRLAFLIFLVWKLFTCEFSIPGKKLTIRTFILPSFPHSVLKFQFHIYSAKEAPQLSQAVSVFMLGSSGADLQVASSIQIVLILSLYFYLLEGFRYISLLLLEHVGHNYI